MFIDLIINVFDIHHSLLLLLSFQKPKVAPGQFDLEKARHEVFQLGIKGFATKDKKEAKRELAIRLGAIVCIFVLFFQIFILILILLQPKKKRGKNIKKHMEEVKLQKQKMEEKRMQSQTDEMCKRR